MNTLQHKRYLKMATFDDDLLSKEELDNIDNDNQGDDDSMKVVLTMKR